MEVEQERGMEKERRGKKWGGEEGKGRREEGKEGGRRRKGEERRRGLEVRRWRGKCGERRRIE